ncbi:glycosyltransferase family 39 protein [Quadrisphaera sp. KR29]|uniref:glycosyltransferase family 39 protein n=1 Tax=Quadrisphaera sp. KR29 TaxID=3461391 RepID=UPI004044B003
MTVDQASPPSAGRSRAGAPRPAAGPARASARLLGGLASLARRHPLVVLVLAFEAVAAGRLRNAAFQDEALYLATGHWLLREWSGGAPLTSAPEGWFTGAPQLYPVLAALLDSAGGLGLVRAASTAFLLLTTVSVAWAAHTASLSLAPPAHPDDEGDDDAGRARTAAAAAAAAALVAACTGPLLALGHFATPDALSIACVAGALALGTRAARPGTSSARWRAASAAAGALLALAVLLKYTSGLVVPCVLLAVLAVAAPGRRSPGGSWRAAGARVAVVAGAGAAVLLVCLATWGRGLVGGFVTSTLVRQPLAPAPASQLVGQVVQDAGLPLLLAVAGSAVVARRSPLLGAALGLGALAPAAAQVLLGEEVSLYKTSALGVVFGAVAAGALVASARAWWAQALTATALVVAVVLGLGVAGRLFSSWPDTDPLRAVLVPLVEARPGAGVAGDNPETMQYALWEQTSSQQWGAFYPGAFQRDGLVDAAAFEAAFGQREFGVVFTDGTSSVGRELEPLMPSYGFEQAAQVSSPDGGRTWTVWALPTGMIGG